MELLELPWLALQLWLRVVNLALASLLSLAVGILTGMEVRCLQLCSAAGLHGLPAGRQQVRQVLGVVRQLPTASCKLAGALQAVSRAAGALAAAFWRSLAPSKAAWTPPNWGTLAAPHNQPAACRGRCGARCASCRCCPCPPACTALRRWILCRRRRMARRRCCRPLRNIARVSERGRGTLGGRAVALVIEICLWLRRMGSLSCLVASALDSHALPACDRASDRSRPPQSLWPRTTPAVST